MCYAPVCYVSNYAEGVKERENTPGELFEGLLGGTEKLAVDEAVNRFLAIAVELARTLPSNRSCICGRSMERYRKEGRVGADWHDWIGEK